MDLSTKESTLKYLEKSMTKKEAYEFILYAIPLLHELFSRAESPLIEQVIEDEEWGRIYSFVVDIMTAYQMQEAEKEMREYRARNEI